MDELTPQQILDERRRPRRALPLVAGVATLALAGAGALALFTSGSDSAPAARPARAVAAAPAPPALPPPRRRPQVVKAVPPGDGEDEVASTTSHESEGETQDTEAEVQRELDEFRKLLKESKTARGAKARIDANGEAIAPAGAPEVVAQVIAAGNQIAKKPYIYGGGHGAWRDRGYDCSGSVSFALAGAGLLDRPMASGGFMRWGSAGKGRWITTYANSGHMFMVVAGLRFDTSGANGGTRWQNGMRGGGGFSVRHPPGL